MFNSRAGRIFTATTISLFSLQLLHAQDAAQPESHGLFSNGMFLVMLSVVILLLFVIFGLAEVVKAGAMQERIRFREAKKAMDGTKKEEEEKKDDVKKIAGTLLLLLLVTGLSAQTSAAIDVVTPAEPEFTYWGMGAGVFYSMLFTILVEISIALFLFQSGMQLIGVKKKMKARRVKPSFIEKMNASVSVAEEEAILMDHDYDGIRELDNNLPPWWKYGFYATIVFAVIYLVHFHVSHTGKLSLEEYAQEVREGDSAVAEYKRTAKDLVDETTVALLTDAGSIQQGKDIFLKNCIGCHGEKGEGNIGPNFTDDYWIHGGSISNVFKSIRDGYIDKGMKAWGAEMKPSDIQLVASFVKSLRGTHPSNAKAAEGELYVEDGKPAVTDTLKVPADTLKK